MRTSIGGNMSEIKDVPYMVHEDAMIRSDRRP